MMSDAMALMGGNYNGYKYRKQEYDDFVAFKTVLMLRIGCLKGRAKATAYIYKQIQ